MINDAYIKLGSVQQLDCLNRICSAPRNGILAGEIQVNKVCNMLTKVNEFLKIGRRYKTK